MLTGLIDHLSFFFQIFNFNLHILGQNINIAEAFFQLLELVDPVAQDIDF